DARSAHREQRRPNGQDQAALQRRPSRARRVFEDVMSIRSVRYSRRRSFLVSGAAAVLLVAGSAPAQAPLPSASADAPDAAAPEVDGIHVSVPEGKTPPPKPAEWESAERVYLAFSSLGCNTHRVREWFRVRCTFMRVRAAELVAGTQNEYFSIRKN